MREKENVKSKKEVCTLNAKRKKFQNATKLSLLKCISNAM